MQSSGVYDPNASKKLLVIEHYIINYNLNELLQKFLRETFRQLFDEKSKTLFKHKRVPVFILNTAKRSLPKIIRMNKNPDVLLFSLADSIYNLKNPNPCLQHPDLKELLMCSQRGELDHTMLVLTGDMSEQFEILIKNGIEFEFVHKGSRGEDVTIPVSSIEQVPELLELLEDFVALKIGDIDFDSIINLEVTNRPFFPDKTIYKTIDNIWDFYHRQFQNTRKNYHKEKAELLRLRKFAIILPGFFSDILTNTMSVDNIRNVDCYESVDAFENRSGEIPADKMINYLEKTNYREVPLYLDMNAQKQIYSIILDKDIFKYLNEVKSSIHNIVSQLKDFEVDQLLTALPQPILKKFGDTNHDMAKLVEGRKSAALEKLFTEIPANYPLAKLLDLMPDSNIEAISKPIRHLLTGILLPHLPPNIKNLYTNDLSIGIPEKAEFMKMDSKKKQKFLEIFHENKDRVNALYERAPFMKRMSKAQIVKSIADLIRLNPNNLFKNFDLDLSTKLLRDISVIDQKLLEPVISKERRAQFLKEHGRQIIENISFKFSSFLKFLESQNQLQIAWTWLASVSKDKNQLNIYVEKALKDDSRMLSRHEKLFSFFKNPANRHIKNSLEKNVTMISGDYDGIVCLKADEERLRELLKDKKTTILAIENEYEKSELGEFLAENIHNLNQDNILSVITKMIEDKIENSKEETSDDPVQIYLNQTIIFILRIISALISGENMETTLKEGDKRKLLRDSIEKSLKKDLLELFKSRNRSLLRTSQFSQKLHELKEKQLDLKNKSEGLQSMVEKLNSAIYKDSVNRNEVFKELSSIVQKQRKFTYDFVNNLREFFLPEHPNKERTGQEGKIFNFTDEEISEIQTKGVYFTSYSVQFRSYLDFCINKDELPADIFPIGDHIGIPANTKKIVIGPDVEERVKATLKKKYPTEDLLFLTQQNYELLLYFNEKDKRTSRKKYMELKERVETLVNKRTSCFQKSDSLVEILTKLSKVVIEQTGVLTDEKEKSRQIQLDVVKRQEMIKKVFVEIKKVDAKFDTFLDKINSLFRDSKAFDKMGMDTIGKLAGELISIYGEFEILLMIQNFLKATEIFSEKIKEAVLNNMLKGDKLILPPNKISRLVYIHDQSEESLENYKIVSTIIDNLLSLKSKYVSSLSLRQINDLDSLTDLAPGTVFILFMNDEKSNMAHINNVTHNLRELMQDFHCIVVTSYKSFDLEFGDQLQNELAMNINSISSRSIVINTRPFMFRKESRLINVIHDVMNF